MSEPVRYDVDDAVATITLDRPDAMNSLDTAAKEALLAAVRRAGGDPDVRCVVLTGTGRAFCVGQDLREHADNLATSSAQQVWATVDRHFIPIARGLAEMPKPVVAAVNGVAAGAGLSIALACDFRVAADSAGFNTAFVGVALSCDTGISWTLQRLVGSGRALDLLLLPRTVRAPEALQLGLVTSVVPADALAAEAASLARKLAQGPTVAYAAVKAAVAYGASHALDEALAFESEMMARTGVTADHREAVRAFLAKQAPTFGGS
jgi:2-(1,2-epoxy-1,2-dihydrophenyl)acetyl-CoA isomerase